LELADFPKKRISPKSSILAPKLALWIEGSAYSSHISNFGNNFCEPAYKKKNLTQMDGPSSPRRVWAQTP
jgi:hypothetical protein